MCIWMQNLWARDQDFGIGSVLVSVRVVLEPVNVQAFFIFYFLFLLMLMSGSRVGCWHYLIYLYTNWSRASCGHVVIISEHTQSVYDYIIILKFLKSVNLQCSCTKISSLQYKRFFSVWKLLHWAKVTSTELKVLINCGNMLMQLIS